MGQFDLSFKALCERDAIAPLKLFGRTAVDASAEVTHLPREVIARQRSVDHSFLIRGARGASYIEHLEAETSFR